MLKTISSGEPPLAVLLAAAIASRSEMRPSAPRLLPRLAIEVVVPSTVSLVVSTTMMPLEVAATFAANSEVSLVARLVAVAVMRSPALTQMLARVVLNAAFPDPSVLTTAQPR